MATNPGEENVATLFADVHYFYSPAQVKPRHHRFDQGSYVYLFENAADRRCRVEIANQPGTSDQDAFDGFLDQTHVRYSYKQHVMVSIAIITDSVPQNQWHLPTYDPRNENKYHYRLHSLDIYFWTQQDALQFVNAIRRVLPPAQVEVLDEPGPPPAQPVAMSSVVQRLENAAISDPRYKNDQQVSMHSTNNSLSRTSFGSQGDPRAPSGGAGRASLPPPPPPPPSQPAPALAPAGFAPMAYNPAAPAAPEAIRHREKTPPPDEDPLNPLAVAVAYDYQRQPFTPGPAAVSQFPPMISGHPPNFAPPPVHPGLHHASTAPVGMHMHTASSGGHAAHPGVDFSGAQGFTPPPPPQTVSPPGFLPPPPPPPQQQQQQQQQPVGGYAHGSFEQNAHPQQGMPVDYSIHRQVYQPTEEESGRKPQSYQAKSEGRARLEENAGRFERGMSGMLKKFEKKFG